MATWSNAGLDIGQHWPIADTMQQGWPPHDAGVGATQASHRSHCGALLTKTSSRLPTRQQSTPCPEREPGELGLLQPDVTSAIHVERVTHFSAGLTCSLRWHLSGEAIIELVGPERLGLRREPFAPALKGCRRSLDSQYADHRTTVTSRERNLP